MKSGNIRLVVVIVALGIIAACFASFLATGVWICNEKFIPPLDNVRVLYETRSIASYATVLIITSAAVFIPLLTLIWSNAMQTISTTLDTLVLLLGNSSVNQNRLKRGISKAHNDIEEITSVGNRFKGLFYVCVGFIILTLLFFLFINFYKLKAVTCYHFVIILNGLSIFVFFFLMALFVIYQRKIRPKIRLYEDRSVFKNIYIKQP
mgnify:CR=1 FL=1